MKILLLMILITQTLLPVLEQPEGLKPVEIRNYEGTDLSSISDFRENSIKGPQRIDLNSYELNITGLVSQPKSLSYTDILENFRSYKKVVTLHCVEGWNATILWEGFLVEDLIGMTDKNASTVIFHARDGYTTSLPLKYIRDKDIILAYRMNNVTLPSERGYPFQLVAESKWGYKWIKWVDWIEVSDDNNYRGYWERRGYSNEGDLDKRFFSF
jgi:DMSO/TMAO reductase YedYZ molybdopterin-dependent catalytic subunit